MEDRLVDPCVKDRGMKMSIHQDEVNDVARS